MGLLLESNVKDVVIPIVILVMIFLVAGLIIYGLKHKYGKDRGMITKDEPKTINVELKKCYMQPNEVEFLKNLYKVLPAEFIAFPRVGVDNLVQPKNDKVLYNTILSQYVDVCVFLKSTMQPVLAIDLYEASPVAQQLKQLHPNVAKALKAVNIPMLSYQLSEEYSLVELRTKVIDAMPGKMIAMLKEKVKNNNIFD